MPYKANAVCGTLQSSEVVGVIVLERCLVQLDDDADQSLYSFIVGKSISSSNHLYVRSCEVLWENVLFNYLLL